MSYKIKNFIPSKQKEKIQKINFKTEQGSITNVFLKDENYKSFKKVILGRQKNSAGRYQIDGSDVINKNFVRTHTEYIKSDTWFERLIPTKWILALSLLSNLEFLRNSRIKYAEKKYDYLSLLDSKNDLTDLKLRRQIDSTIKKYTSFLNESHEKIYENLNDTLRKINKEKSETIFGEFSPQIKVLSKAIFDMELETRINQMEFKFVQVLYDQIDSLNNLRDSCTCEYNTKKSKNRQLRKRKSFFEFKQTKFIIEKQLKFLNIRLNKLRLESIKLFLRKKVVNQQLKFELDKFYKTYSVSKDSQQNISNELSNWKRIIIDKFEDNKKNQNQFLFSFVKNETVVVSKYIVSIIHDYHKLILTAEVKYGNKNEFLTLRKHYKKQIIPITKQAEIWMEENFKKLNINFEWFLKGSFKLSSLNMIYAKILKAINLGKKNIILSDFLHLLTNRDYQLLFETIRQVNRFYPEISFIILHTKSYTIDDLKKTNKIYWVNNKELIETNMVEFFSSNFIDICKNDLNDSNIFAYSINSENMIDIEDRLWNIKTNRMKKEGLILINPLEVSNDFIESNSVPINIKIIRNTKFHDKNMYYGITKNKTKFYFYNEDKKYEREKEAVVYLEEKSIAKII